MERIDSGNNSPPISGPPQEAGCLRVLLVEDFVPEAEQIIGELSKANFHCTTRRVESRAAFEAELGAFPPDMILASYSAAEFSGLEALRWLQSRKLDIPVIIVSGAQSEEVAVQCLQYGAEDYVLKSGLKRLPSAVLNALKRKETERSKELAKEALRRSEEQYRLIAENVRDLICLLDLHGRFLYASPSFEAVLRRPPKDLTGRSISDLVHPDDRAILAKLMEEARFLHESRTGDVRYLHHDGSSLTFEAAVGFVFDQQGAPQRAVIVSRDVSERRLAESEIESLAAFPRNNPNPVLAFAGDGSLIYFNDAAQAMAQALKKEHPKDMLPLNVAAMVKMSLAAGQSNLRMENTIAGRTLCWSFYPVQSGPVVHCYAEDVTERLELEARLRQSQKMESVGQLAAGVAHDFNNILTIIQGHAGLLQGNREMGPGAAESLNQIRLAAERASNLTRQLLMFSRKQLAQRQLVDLNEVIKEAGKMLRVLTGESIQLKLDCQPNLPAVYADPGMIEQILVNLAVNARDAMPRGGNLTIASASEEISDAHADRVPEARPGRFVRLNVVDNGCGMDAATMERIFEPFFTTKEPGRGTGLGLATVYGIAKQHQGWVEVGSAMGQGTTFSVYLPAASKSAELDTDLFRIHVRGGHETILVVEDEPALRELVLEILQQYGYQTIEASNGVHALRLWNEKKAQINLVLTDVMMPDGVSGRDLAEAIQRDDPKMRVIYTSGYPMDVLGRDFFQKESIVFLQKPYHPQTLAKTVRECLDK